LQEGAGGGEAATPTPPYPSVTAALEAAPANLSIIAAAVRSLNLTGVCVPFSLCAP
jgi:hypothetical protein